MLLWEGSSWQSVYNMGRVSGSGWVSIQLPRGSCLLVDLKDGPKRLFEYPEAIISAILFIIIVIIIHSDLKTIENCFLKIVCFCVWFAAFFTTPRIICIWLRTSIWKHVVPGTSSPRSNDLNWKRSLQENIYSKFCATFSWFFQK